MTEPRLTRRALLGAAGAGCAALAAGAFLPACSPATGGAHPLDAAAVARITGAIVGPDATRGHALRTPASAPWAGRSPASTERVRTVIAGAGMAGLSAAWALDRAGWSDYRVLELEPRVGGTSSWHRTPASGCPWGAHYLPLPTAEATAARVLLREMGVITGLSAAGHPVYDEEALCQAPQERLYIHGHWQEGLWPESGATADDHAQLDRFRADMERWRSFKTRDGRPPFTLPIALSSTDERVRALDQTSMDAWLRNNGYTSARLRWFVEYATRDDFGCTLESTSAWAAIHYFTSRVDTARAASNGTSDSDPVLTWPEGNGHIARWLRERVGTSRIQTDALVFHVDVTPRDVVVDWYDGHDVRRVICDSVVLAMPRFVAARVCPAYATSAGEAIAAFTYAPWVVSNVEVERVPENRTAGIAPCWDNVIHASDTLGYVVATHQSLHTVEGPSVLTHYRPLTRGTPRDLRQAALRAPWTRWRDEVLADLAIPHPGIEHLAQRIDVMVWGHGMVRPTPGFVWSAARASAARAPRRVALAHTDLSGVALFEEAQFWGVRAAQQIMREARHPFEALA